MILGGFGVVWGVILGAKGRPKWLQNLIKKLSDFWIALGSALGRQRVEYVSTRRPFKVHGEDPSLLTGEPLPPPGPQMPEVARPENTVFHRPCRVGGHT